MDCKLSVVARMEGEHKTDVYEKVMDNSQEIFQIFFFFFFSVFVVVFCNASHKLEPSHSVLYFKNK